MCCSLHCDGACPLHRDLKQAKNAAKGFLAVQSTLADHLKDRFGAARPAVRGAEKRVGQLGCTEEHVEQNIAG